MCGCQKLMYEPACRSSAPIVHLIYICLHSYTCDGIWAEMSPNPRHFGYLFLTADPKSWPCRDLLRLHANGFRGGDPKAGAVRAFSRKDMYVVVVAQIGAFA